MSLVSFPVPRVGIIVVIDLLLSVTICLVVEGWGRSCNVTDKLGYRPAGNGRIERPDLTCFVSCDRLSCHHNICL